MHSAPLLRTFLRLTIIALILGALWFLMQRQLQQLTQHSPSPPQTDEATNPPPASATPPAEVPIGDKILADYLSPQQTAKQDLQILRRLLDTYFIAVKSTDALPMSANEEIIATLAGQRKNKLPFLTLPHPAINAQGQLIDRWGSPVHFHQLAQKQYEIRTAGPDRTPYTDDDLVINPQGRF
jgi:hypothetical protein